ncbi:methylated-DNA--[protein]-cysteine S-methyltransferase [Bifidobacterium sp. LC6]|uniref:Methylated-DNA--protein-cysteine methyltransferase n=1 Tax=Bifidobacterium colobi TaxID=2809026 RepID=A0ABS5UT26_9BIFI|nr:methylated-DNA--[protein]-cysteine S-methyltransferase [Bifidobacterium colobi]MBT1173990.1 methylated-DNA--[protein]-cysteine S-methyltransferase [Bifidobacterium colobi]
MTHAQTFRATVETPIGRMIMASDGTALNELCLEDWWWAAPATTAPTTPATTEAGAANALPVFHQTAAWLNAYFAGERPALDTAPPLAPHGTAFQQEVWQLVREIPYGHTVSYGELAAELAERRGGGRMAAQAVGGAVKRNPITIIVPCHRVVGSGRSFGGYGGRLDVKATLLELEGVSLARFDLAAPRTETQQYRSL